MWERTANVPWREWLIAALSAVSASTAVMAEEAAVAAGVAHHTAPGGEVWGRHHLPILFLQHSE